MKIIWKFHVRFLNYPLQDPYRPHYSKLKNGLSTSKNNSQFFFSTNSWYTTTMPATLNLQSDLGEMIFASFGSTVAIVLSSI